VKYGNHPILSSDGLRRCLDNVLETKALSLNNFGCMLRVGLAKDPRLFQKCPSSYIRPKNALSSALKQAIHNTQQDAGGSGKVSRTKSGIEDSPTNTQP